MAAGVYVVEHAALYVPFEMHVAESDTEIDVK